MNDDLQSFIEPELEARLVALILEEASAFEVEELERILKEQPEVALAKKRLEEAHGLLGQAMEQPDDDDDWKLPSDRREKVLAAFDEGTSDLDDSTLSKERGISIAQWRSIYATAACLMVAVVVLALVGPMKNQIPEGESALVSYSDGRKFLEEDIRGQEDMLREMQAKSGNDNDSRLAVLSRYEENAFSNSEKTAKEYLADIDDGLGAISPDDALATIELHNRKSKNQNLAGLDGVRNSRSKSERTKLKRAVSKEGEDLNAVAALRDKELTRADGEKPQEFKSKSLERDERWSGRVAKTKPAKKPSSSMAQLVPAKAKPGSMPKIIAANSTSPASIPVPDLPRGSGAKTDFDEDGFGGDLGGGSAGRGVELQKLAEKSNARSFPVTPASPVSPSSDPFASESSGGGGGGDEGQADPFAAGTGDKALKSSSTRGNGYAGGFVHLDDRSTEAKDGNTFQRRKALPKNGKAVDGSVRSADINGAASLKERMVEKRDSSTDVSVDRMLLKPREFSLSGNESWKMEKAKGEASTNVEVGGFVTEIAGLDIEEVKKEKDSKSRLLGMDFSDERFEGEKNPEGFSRKSGLAAKIDEFSKQDKAAPGQVVGGIATGGLRSRESSITTKNVEGSEFSLAKGLRDLGRFDTVEKEFKEALQKDPASKEARRGLARIASEKSYYYRSSYDETRARMLQEVDKTWELAIPSGDAQAVVEDSKEDDQEIDLEAIPLYTADDESGVKRRGIAAKLQNIILPEVDLNNVTVEEAMALLEQGALAHDPDGEGLTLDVRKPRVIDGGAVAGGGLLGEVIDPGAIKIDKLHLKNVPLQVAAQYVADKAKLKYRVDEGKVTFLPLTSSETADIVTRRFEVPENFGAFLSSNGGAAGSDDDSFATPGDNGGSGIKARQPIVDLLKRQGVVFIDGTSASLLTDSGSLVVRNTPSQLELVDAILAASVQDAEKKKAEKEARKLAQQKRVNFETLTTEKSDSTFSLNVSDVSFKLAKSSLSQGKWPEAAKVRPEEFVNALNYDDRKPSQSEKVACEIEQGAHPFMQQRNLMRVSMSTAALGRNASTPLRLTILLDQSGSMERADRAESVKRAFALLTDQLNAGDEITLVGFARTPRLLAERVKGNESKNLLEIVSQPITEGGTNLEGALDSGIQLAKQQFVDGAQNRIILLTDGAANLGDALPANLAKQVEKMRQAGIAFDACGVGADGLNDEVLSSLAKQGDGRYYFLDRPEDADDGFARQIAGALRPAAKNVKVQVIFNPRRVSKFKLYGFEKHLLKKEDFRNDTVDAAEMAAEESGVALYHFEALPEGEGDVGHVSVRFLDTATDQMVERKWNIPFEEDVTSFTDSDPALRLAGTAALFAEKLKGSAVGERVQLKELRKEADSLQGSYQSQARFHELRTMLQQAGE
ncbi:von Willebrand factor type A domain-containing protein [Akkermansiaceae bacterium]|nr:von Willebrand factor type A domain-containing protein [Akkermansiaceae bacterium]